MHSFTCAMTAEQAIEPSGCTLQGGRGSSACRAEGTGALRDVRIINLLQDTLFWFRVDSRVPGHMGHDMPGAEFSYGLPSRESTESSPRGLFGQVNVWCSRGS